MQLKTRSMTHESSAFRQWMVGTIELSSFIIIIILHDIVRYRGGRGARFGSIVRG